MMVDLLKKYKGKTTTFGTVLELANEHFEFGTKKEARTLIVDFIDNMESYDPRVIKVLGA